jgi:putative FmdB family regulatory protein
MPTYEYECKICAYTFDVFQSMSDEPVKICPQCGREVRRLINGGTGVIFKGSGFYVTDKGKGAAAKPEAKASTPQPEKTDAAGTADKPAAPEKAAPAAPGAPPASTEKKASGQ